MAVSRVPLFWFIHFMLCFFFTSADQKEIPAEPGQNVTLPCRVTEPKPVLVVEWSRTDLGDEFVLLFKDHQINPSNQHPSYKNRVDLQDRQMKDGDVSLVLKNLTINDTGKYECRVQIKGTLDAKLINIINLNVSTAEKKEAGNQSGPTGLIVGLILFVVVVIIAAGVSYLIYRKQSACFKKKIPDSPADL